jgi:hypothetical protein
MVFWIVTLFSLTDIQVANILEKPVTSIIYIESELTSLHNLQTVHDHESAEVSAG